MDTDGDLIPDGFEMRHNLDPLVPNAVDQNNNGLFDDWKYTNSDGDSLTDIQKYRYITNPRLTNSDGGNSAYPDNASDSVEVSQGSNPDDPTDGGHSWDADEMLSIDPVSGSETRVCTLRSGGFGNY